MTNRDFPQWRIDPTTDPNELRQEVCQEITKLAFRAQHLGMSNAANVLHTANFAALKDAQRLSDTGEVK